LKGSNLINDLTPENRDNICRGAFKSFTSVSSPLLSVNNNFLSLLHQNQKITHNLIVGFIMTLIQKRRILKKRTKKTLPIGL